MLWRVRRLRDEEINTSGVGTGPFRLSTFRPGGRGGSIEAVDEHFAGRPVLDGIDLFSIQDPQARVNALMAKQVDLISQTTLDFATAQEVAASSTSPSRAPGRSATTTGSADRCDPSRHSARPGSRTRPRAPRRGRSSRWDPARAVDLVAPRTTKRPGRIPSSTPCSTRPAPRWTPTAVPRSYVRSRAPLRQSEDKVHAGAPTASRTQTRNGRFAA